MAKYRKISPSIWNDAKFRGFSDDAQLVFFLLLTHPYMTLLGAMRGTIPGLAAEKGWAEARFRKGFGEPLLKGMAKHDERASFIWLPNFIRYNPPDNPNVVKSWGASLDLLPECAMKYELIQHLREYVKGLPKGFYEGLPEHFSKGLANQEQEQEQEQEQDIPLTSFEGACAREAMNVRKASPAKAKKKMQAMPQDIAAQTTLKTSIFDQALWDWCQEKYPSVNIEAQWEHFVSQCLARDYTYADFRHAFRNSFVWERSPAQRGGGMQGQQRSPTPGNTNGLTEKEYRTVMASQAAMEALDHDDRRRQTAILPGA